MKISKILFILAYLLFSASARADFISVIANIGAFLQSGIIINASDPGYVINSITLDLGAPFVGGGTLDRNNGTALSGGVPINLLSNGNHFQTLRFSGLSVTPGNSFQYAGLDLDVINNLAPLIVGGAGGAITNASLSVGFDKGQFLTMQFDNLPSLVPQSLRASALVSEPRSFTLWFLVAILSLAVMLSRQYKTCKFTF